MMERGVGFLWQGKKGLMSRAGEGTEERTVYPDRSFTDASCGFYRYIGTTVDKGEYAFFKGEMFKGSEKPDYVYNHLGTLDDMLTELVPQDTPYTLVRGIQCWSAEVGGLECMFVHTNDTLGVMSGDVWIRIDGHNSLLHWLHKESGLKISTLEYRFLRAACDWWVRTKDDEKKDPTFHECCSTMFKKDVSLSFTESEYAYSRCVFLSVDTESKWKTYSVRFIYDEVSSMHDISESESKKFLECMYKPVFVNRDKYNEWCKRNCVPSTYVFGELVGEFGMLQNVSIHIMNSEDTKYTLLFRSRYGLTDEDGVKDDIYDKCIENWKGFVRYLKRMVSGGSKVQLETMRGTRFIAERKIGYDVMDIVRNM